MKVHATCRKHCQSFSKKVFETLEGTLMSCFGFFFQKKKKNIFWNFSFIDFGKLIISLIENVIFASNSHTDKFKAKYLIIFFSKIYCKLIARFFSNSSQINHCFKSLLDFTKHCYIVCTDTVFRQVHFEHVVSHTKEK